MRLFTKQIPGGRGLAPALRRRAATLTLDWDVRQKSRFEAVDAQGRPVGVVLGRGRVLRGGDVLVGEDGSLLRIVAAPQAVLQVQAASPFALMRAAYHLGNRHVPLEVQPERLQLEPDHVLAALLRSMGLQVVEARAAFEPEAGAYAGGGLPHGHGHSHDHDHDQGRGHDDHDHAPGHRSTAPSAHGCGRAPWPSGGRASGTREDRAAMAAPHRHPAGLDRRPQ